jgi:hypothetical protein
MSFSVRFLFRNYPVAAAALNDASCLKPQPLTMPLDFLHMGSSSLCPYFLPTTRATLMMDDTTATANPPMAAARREYL